jgi:cytidylate kinase
MIVTIDGPVAGGKSTAARNLAAALGFEHFDSGAVYRAVTLAAVRAGVDPCDGAAVRALLGRIEVRYDRGRAFLAASDVSDAIRTPEITSAVRPFAENADVRAFVNGVARGFSAGRDMVVEGRDMGTVVFPDADVKIYLAASAEERARRRCEELRERGTHQEYETVLRELRERDRADESRALSPLRKAPGAVEVDSTGWSQDQTLRRLVEIVDSRRKDR